MKLTEEQMAERKAKQKAWTEYHAWIKSYDKPERFKSLKNIENADIAIEPGLLWTEFVKSRKDA